MSHISIARVNGVALHAPNATLSGEELRQRVCTELLRQAAQRAGLLPATDTPETSGAISEAAPAAIVPHLDRELRIPEPSDETCRRYYESNKRRYAAGDRLRLRH